MIYVDKNGKIEEIEKPQLKKKYGLKFSKKPQLKKKLRRLI